MDLWGIILGEISQTGEAPSQPGTITKPNKKKKRLLSWQDKPETLLLQPSQLPLLLYKDLLSLVGRHLHFAHCDHRL